MALARRDGRSTDILNKRYGLKKPEIFTLEEIGGDLNLTRERVRQIESRAIELSRQELENNERAKLLVELLHGYLNGVGNLRRDDLLAWDLKRVWGSNQKVEIFGNRLRFLSEVLDGPIVVSETVHSRAYWHNDVAAEKLALKLIQKLHSYRQLDFDSFLGTAASQFKVTEPLIINYLSVSKNFMVGPYGDLGSGNWLHVNPKTVRDKTYLILLKAGHPMHFEEIAKEVNAIGPGRRSAATVHNELIRDKRFILVKRGIYTIIPSAK